MNCPNCDEPIFKKKTGQSAPRLNTESYNDRIYRRRECPNCSFRFSTTEILMKDWNYLRYKVQDLLKKVEVAIGR